MPLLEYRCASCQEKAELLVLAGDGVVKPVCPSCGSPKMTRLLSTFAAHGGSGAARDADTMCGGRPCEMPERCGPSTCDFGEN